MSLIIIDTQNGKITVMPNTHERGHHADRETALEKYCETARTSRTNFDWMEFDGPLAVNFL